MLLEPDPSYHGDRHARDEHEYHNRRERRMKHLISQNATTDLREPTKKIDRVAPVPEVIKGSAVELADERPCSHKPRNAHQHCDGTYISDPMTNDEKCH